jgi:hypothetical protein
LFNGCPVFGIGGTILYEIKRIFLLIPLKMCGKPGIFFHVFLLLDAHGIPVSW